MELGVLLSKRRIILVHGVKLLTQHGKHYSTVPHLELTKQAEGGKTMALADGIREFADEHYIQPARERGDRQFTIRAGDLHDDMGLHARLPAVSAALGANKFEDAYAVRRVSIEGPLNGANCLLTFEIR